MKQGVIRAEVPTHLSMRMSNLKNFGGDLYDIEDYSRREYKHYLKGCPKDRKDYRPWQRQRDVIEELKHTFL